MNQVAQERARTTQGSRRTSTGAVMVYLVAGIGLGVLGTWWVMHHEEHDLVPVDVVQGTTVWVAGIPGGSPIGGLVMTAETGYIHTRLGFGPARGQRYSVGIVGAHNYTCLDPGETPQRVALGVVHAAPSPESAFGAGGDVVVWVDCLG